MAKPGTEFVRCGDCQAWRKVVGLPKAEGYRFCVIYPRRAVQAIRATIPVPPACYLMGTNWAFVYPLHAEDDGCFYGVEIKAPKGK